MTIVDHDTLRSTTSSFERQHAVSLRWSLALVENEDDDDDDDGDDGDDNDDNDDDRCWYWCWCCECC